MPKPTPPTVSFPETEQPFRYFCQRVLPAVYSDELSYYEMLCKVADYLNVTISNVNILNDDVKKINEFVIEMYEWIENYFNSLDVQEEINKRLDEYVKDGTLANLLKPFTTEFNKEIELIKGDIQSTNAKIQSTNERIDNIIFSNQPTEGNTELIDIRAQDNGYIFPSAGMHVRNIDEQLMPNVNVPTANYAFVYYVTNGAIIDEPNRKIVFPAGLSGYNSYAGYRLPTFSTWPYSRYPLLITLDFNAGELPVEAILIENADSARPMQSGYIVGSKAFFYYSWKDNTVKNITIAIRKKETEKLTETSELTITGVSTLNPTPLNVEIDNINNIINTGLEDISGLFSVTNNANAKPGASWNSDTNTLTLQSGYAYNNCYAGYISDRTISEINGKRISGTFVANVNTTDNIEFIVKSNKEITDKIITYNTIEGVTTANFSCTVPDGSVYFYAAMNINTSTPITSPIIVKLISFDSRTLELTSSESKLLSKWADKKMSCFGDSYTAQNGWQQTVVSILGLREYKNTAISGGTLVYNYKSIENTDKDSDIVTILYGTNDYASNANLGTMQDPSSTTPATFYSALRYVFEWLSINLPSAKILPMTHTQRWGTSIDVKFKEDNGINDRGFIKNNLGFSLEDYANAIVEVARLYGFTTLDMFHDLGVNEYNDQAFYVADLLHPNPKGYSKIAYAVSAKLVQ